MKLAPASGFTSVELVLAMVAAAILAITAGTLVYLAHVAWAEELIAVDLQRDATFALDVIGHELRPAGRQRVTITAGRMEIAGTGTTQAIYIDTDDLIRDPSTGTSGDEMVLIRDRVTAFTPTISGPGVAVHLQLVDGENQITMNSLTRWRN